MKRFDKSKIIINLLKTINSFLRNAVLLTKQKGTRHEENPDIHAD